ncbi:MAG: YoaK family protein [Bdellovibrionia bacterium]
MFHHRIDDPSASRVFVKWYILAFAAGSINAGAFMAAGRFVTHMTGFGTLFGVEVAHARWEGAIGILFVPAFFLLGTMISAYMVDHRFHRGRRPHYDWVMFLEVLCLVAAAVGGQLHFFGSFGEPLKLKSDFALLALLCLASGLQNAAITSATGSSVRTTHLTGITTDLGIGIVRALALKGHRKHHDREVRANWLRAGTIFSFYAGSVVGAILFLKVQYYGFYLPAAIAFYGLHQAKLENDRQRKREARKAHLRGAPVPAPGPERIQSPNA